MGLFDPTKTLDEVIADLKTYLEGNTDKLSDWNVGSVLRTIMYATGQEISKLYEDSLTHRKQAYIATATGDGLDLKVQDIGVERKAAVKATGYVQFSCSSPASSDILIPVGTRVRTEADATGNTVTVETVAVGTLLAGTTSITIQADATDAGAAGNVATGTLTVPVDQIAGIEAVTNSSAFTGGADRETDEALRARAIKTLAGLARATETGYEAGALSVTGVVAVTVIENDPTPGNVKVYVADSTGTADASLLNEVYGELDANYRGIATTLQVLSPDPISVDVSLTITVAAGNSEATTQSNVQTAVEQYLEERGMGLDVIEAKIVATAMSVSGVENVAVDLIRGSATDQVLVEAATGGETDLSLPHSQIVSGSDVIKKNDVALTRGTDYTINTTTGDISLAAALIPNDEVTASYEYEADTDLTINTYEKPKAGTVAVS